MTTPKPDQTKTPPTATQPAQTAKDTATKTPPVQQPPGERGGPPGAEPTRYGDWDVNGRCTDF